VGIALTAAGKFISEITVEAMLLVASPLLYDRSIFRVYTILRWVAHLLR
jgi:hypothetical protein